MRRWSIDAWKASSAGIVTWKDVVAATCSPIFPGWLWSSTWWAPSWWPVWGWSSRTWRKIALGIIGGGNEKRAKSNACSFDTLISSDLSTHVFGTSLCLGDAHICKLAQQFFQCLQWFVWGSFPIELLSTSYHIIFISILSCQCKNNRNVSSTVKSEQSKTVLTNLTRTWNINDGINDIYIYIQIFLDYFKSPKTNIPVLQRNFLATGRDDGRHYRAKVPWRKDGILGTICSLDLARCDRDIFQFLYF